MKLKKILVLILFSTIPVFLSAQPAETDSVVKSAQEKAEELTRSDIVRYMTQSSEATKEFNNRFHRTFTEKPGLAFLSSAILPGSAQAAKGSWWRAGLYTAVEAASIFFIIDYNNRGVRGERNYERFADQNWSVVQYANWLVEYHDYHGIDNPFIDDLETMVQGVNPAFNPDIDWDRVDISLLRQVERGTPYFTTDEIANNNFSHTLPAYGSQQYYELISKYYQFQGGWRDYDTSQFLIGRTGGTASPMFFDGASQAKQFNDDFRTSRNIMILLISNHLISAFDAYFSFTMKQNRIEATPSAVPGRQFQFRYNF